VRAGARLSLTVQEERRGKESGETVWGLAVNVRTECGNSGQGGGWRVIKNISTENKFITKMG
jgi:hypothetical protein